MKYKTKKCELCGIEFSKLPSESKEDWYERKFCSHNCYGKSRKGIPRSDKIKQKISDGNKGKHQTEEAKEKIRNANIGKIGYWNGISRSEEDKEKISNGRKGKYCGVNSPNWKGGISFEPYCPRFNNKLREEIRNRDNRTCQLCSKIEESRKLSVHHVHYDKENCYPDLITLCVRCNSKVNSNRDYWEEFFMTTLKDRGLTPER